MTNTSKAIVIGDQHFKVNNIPEIEEYIMKTEMLVKEKNPDFIVLLGDMLDQHEKIHTVPLNKAVEFIDRMRNIAKTFVIVGNHDMCHNRTFLTPEHWLNALKEWENVIIVDNVKKANINGNLFIFCPYVFPGRFEEALNTLSDDDIWKSAKCIFAHQEFVGCKMGAIISIDGDIWNEKYPHVISGHIHKNQTIDNIYYPGSSMQVSFGETDRNVISYVTFEKDKTVYTLEEIEIDLPRKKIVYMDVDDLETFNLEKSKDKLKITISGSYEEFKTLKKTKKYKEITSDGIQIVFKSKKKEIKNMKGRIEEQIENQKNNFSDGTNFRQILNESIKNEKNPYLFETFEYIINDRNVDHKDVIYI